MLNRIHLMTAAALMVSAGLFVSSPVRADDVTVTHSSTVVLDNNGGALPPGITAKNLNDDKVIDKAFKKLSEDALSHNGFDNVVSMLVDQDRENIKKSAGKASLTNIDGNNNKRLNDLEASINDAFKNKYNKKVDIDYKAAFTPGFISIQTGEVNDPNLLVGKWPVMSSGFAHDAGGRMTAEDARITEKKSFGGDVNLEKGRNVAVAHIMSSHGMPAVTASLIHEAASGWKFDIPNTMSAQRLYDNLLANLGTINTASLPADVNDADRMVAHAVTAALYDIDLAHNPGTANLNGARPSDSINVDLNKNTTPGRTAGDR